MFLTTRVDLVAPPLTYFQGKNIYFRVILEADMCEVLLKSSKILNLAREQYQLDNRLRINVPSGPVLRTCKSRLERFNY